MLIVFNMIADIISNKKHELIISEFSICGWKLKVSLVFITQSDSADPKNVKSNSAHGFIMRILYKRDLGQVVFNH